MGKIVFVLAWSYEDLKIGFLFIFSIFKIKKEIPPWQRLKKVTIFGGPAPS